MCDGTVLPRFRPVPATTLHSKYHGLGNRRYYLTTKRHFFYIMQRIRIPSFTGNLGVETQLNDVNARICNKTIYLVILENNKTPKCTNDVRLAAKKLLQACIGNFGKKLMQSVVYCPLNYNLNECVPPQL